MGLVSALYSKLKYYVYVICNVLFVELLIKLKNLFNESSRTLYSKNDCTFAGDLADLLLV